MESQYEEMKKALLAEIEKIVDEMLEWGKRHPAPTLTEIEEVALKLRQRFGHQVAEFLLKQQAAARPVPGPICSECGQEMQYKWMGKVTVESRIGPLEIERGYYYCGRCRSGLFPLDQQLRLRDRHWSEGVVKEAVWLSALMPYDRVAETLERIGQIPISATTVWRLTQEYGEEFRQWEERERKVANALPSEEEPEQGKRKGKRMGVAMDGGMIHIRGEGWKELKVGCVFEVDQRRVTDRETKEEIEVGRAVRQSYVAHLGGPEEFGEKLWAEAKRRGWEESVDTEAIGDGAAWIWNLTATHFYDSHQVVDWYHAKDHLVSAVYLLDGEGTERAKQRLKEWETMLYQGHALRIAQRLEAEARGRPQAEAEILREAGYFRNNHRRMNYMEMREEGWVIGSGMVESGIKQFRARFAGPGMRWSRIGAERLLPVRAAVMSQRYDQLWPQLYAPS